MIDKKEVEPLSQYYESTSSLDTSTQDEEEFINHSKLEASFSASDSGLIGRRPMQKNNTHVC